MEFKILDGVIGSKRVILVYSHYSESIEYLYRIPILMVFQQHGCVGTDIIEQDLPT